MKARKSFCSHANMWHECSSEARAPVCVSNSGETCKTRWLISLLRLTGSQVCQRKSGREETPGGKVMVQGKVSANLWSSHSCDKRGWMRLGLAEKTGIVLQRNHRTGCVRGLRRGVSLLSQEHSGHDFVQIWAGQREYVKRYLPNAVWMMSSLVQRHESSWF